MPPKSPNDKSAYKSKIKLYLEKLKHGEVQATNVDLAKININTSATKVGALSEDVKMYMYLSDAKRYHALNDRTINLLMKGDVGMSATTGETGEAGNLLGEPSDFELKTLANNETKVEVFVVDKNKTRAGGSFFPYLNTTILDLNMACLNLLVERIINIIVFTPL